MKNLVTCLGMIAAVVYSSLSFGCYEERIKKPSPFMGNRGEVFTLNNGTVFQVQSADQYLFRYYPQVTVCADQNFVVVAGTKIDVQQKDTDYKWTISGGSAPGYIESSVDGYWEGWRGDTIVKLTNGQAWKQSEPAYSLTMRRNPDVVVYRDGPGYYMSIAGERDPVVVIRTD